MFIEIPPSKKSIAFRRPVYGVGINDAHYQVMYVKDNKRSRCPYYCRWSEMLKRCYSHRLHKKRPTYKECIVIQEWLLFSNFRNWMKLQKWENRELDKDLLSFGVKIYSPETCLFVPSSINNIILENTATRGSYPKGVTKLKDRNVYRAMCNVNGKNNHIGYYPESELAHSAYMKFKGELIRDVANNYRDEQKLFDALIERSNEFLGVI